MPPPSAPGWGGGGGGGGGSLGGLGRGLAAAAPSASNTSAGGDGLGRDPDPDLDLDPDPDRRAFLGAATAAAAAAAAASGPGPAAASDPFSPPRTGESIYVLPGRRNTTSYTSDLSGLGDSRTVEECLLKVLPVRNKQYRLLQKDLVESVAAIRGKAEGDPAAAGAALDPVATAATDPAAIDKRAWAGALQAAERTLRCLDGNRNSLQPVFNRDDSAEMQIQKAERGEVVIGTLRDRVADLVSAIASRDVAATVEAQRRSLGALAAAGELLVDAFPYNVPTTGRFSTLPRLQGRTRITFGMARGGRFLGNVTVVADGFAAPITAGNFVDLCARGFYTGLPIREVRKRFGIEALESDIDELVVQKDASELLERIFGNVISDDYSGGDTISATIPVWGSYQEGVSPSGHLCVPMPFCAATLLGSCSSIYHLTSGQFPPSPSSPQFYDPLTARPRRIPLEVVQIDANRNFKLAYAGGFSKFEGDDISTQDNRPRAKKPDGGERLFRPAISFDVPGVVALNHPDRYLNGGSSEFFCLSREDQSKDRSRMLNGQYAPFGYVTEGYGLLSTLRPGDVISSTDVSEFGLLNLVKVRSTSFGELLSGDGES